MQPHNRQPSPLPTARDFRAHSSQKAVANTAVSLSFYKHNNVGDDVAEESWLIPFFIKSCLTEARPAGLR